MESSRTFVHILAHSRVYVAPYLHHDIDNKAWCKLGTVVPRKNAKGETRYRAQIQIRKDGVAHSESRTFSKKTLAQEWIKRREAEIERDPSILTAEPENHSMTLANALERYLAEVEGFGRSKRMGLRFMTHWPIGSVPLNQLTRQHYSEHTMMRRNGYPLIGAAPCAASTASQDLQYIKTVLSHADLVWGEKVDMFELEQAMKGLRNARMIARSKVRDRLPTNDELQQLTAYFFKVWKRGNTQYPMHLIMWFAIYSCRRQSEINSLYMSDFNRDQSLWLVRDLKNPNGSEGNHKYAAISPECMQVIDAALEPNVQKLICGDGSKLFALEPKTLGMKFKQGCRMLGIEDLHFHDLRHEGATRLAEAGLTIPQIQQYTLHDTWSSLERYASSRPRQGHSLGFCEALAAITDQPASPLPPQRVERPNRPLGRPPKPKTAT
ncbi:MAG: tyrosine-type recombinase/integrase [Pseudomonadota bacterium]|nr:tyrosine-type recombinase/integrase [Pseudomonadota bacterium]